jgi:hypothetical protein
VEWNKFATGDSSHPTTTDPVLVLDSGARLGFVAIETEVGEYGVELVLRKAAEHA